ncbi:MAG: 1-deoxy-D-xylulose-5-phosphate synthase [Patescibacteria group bacterium]|nr:1-deoxy-D-xylulose-5-phosphate synthase [Patescibacteria group bacterium]
MSILDKIEHPQDLKQIPVEDLYILCQEIREYIHSVILTTGGHFASSLGAVELTVALHYVYNTPVDKIIWDVGHQAYVHKILTGRREPFKSIRQLGGISGFLKREESEYDVFGAGHASTAISAGLGAAVGRDLAGKNFKVLCIVGDGGMTGGLSYEGMNNAGTLGHDLTIILNDNKMSISQNVGAMSQYLTNIISNPFYNRLKKEIWELTGKFPSVSNQVRLLARRIEESFKNLVVPGMLFEDLGIKYYGPVDGHNLTDLIAIFNNVKGIPGPKLIHVLTQKGMGVDQAEADPCKYHGVKPSGIAAPASQTETQPLPSYTEIFGKTIVNLARRDPRVVVITAAMEEGTGLTAFHKEFPERFFDVGIAESHAVTFAGGLITEGFKPIVTIYSTFLQRAFDNIFHDITLQKFPVIFALDRAGLVGEDGPTHHGCFDFSYLGCIPNTVISAPKDGQELVDLFYTALQYEDGPFFIRYPRDSATIPSNENGTKLSIGSWETLKSGNDVVLLAVGSMVTKAMDVAAKLETEAISAEVINCRFVKPLDTEMLAVLSRRFTHLVTIEENAIIGGFGSQVTNYFLSHALYSNRIVNIGIPDAFITHGKRSQLLDIAGLSTQSILTQVLSFLNVRKEEKVKTLEYIA